MSSRIWKQVTQCLCLYLCILLAWPAYAQEETAVAAAEVIAPLPTPTPVPAPPAVAEEPTSTALEGTTEEPTPEAPATEPPATEPPAETTAAPTGPSATPPATATVSPGATASVAPTATDTATVTPAPSNSPTPAPSAAPGWDESKCDHRNEHCERAPKCAIEGCAHVGIDEQGNPKALCPLGQWLLDASVSANEPGAALLSASTPTEIALKNGMNTLYRSGSYVLTGGGAGAEVVVGKNLAVSIVLKDTQLLRLTLSEGVACTLGFEEQNAVTSLAAPNAELTMNGIGSLVVSTNFNCPRLTVLGGSVRLPSYTGADEIISLNGRKPYPFYASGALSATLEGQFLCELRPNAADQAAVLWLPPLEDQLPYYSKLENQTLVLTAIPAPPGKAVEFSLTGSDAFAPMENTDYRIVPGDQPQSKQLTIAKNGVSVTMSGIGEASYAPSVIAQAPATLFFQKQNVLGELNGSAGVTLSGSGSLSVQTLGVPALKAVGTLSISCGAVAGTALDRWQVVSTDADLALGTIASYNGQKASLCFLTGDLRTAYVPIAAPAPGYRYVGTLKGKTLKVEALPSSAALGTLGTTALTLSSGNYLLRSAPSATGDVVIPAGESVLLTLEDVQTTVRLLLEAGASATLTLTGANGFAGQTALGAKAKLTIDGTGALRFGAMTGEKGSSTTLGEQVSVTLATGDALAGSKLKPTLIRVTNNQNAPMAKTAITLKLGKDEPFSTTTDEQGLLMLWRGKALTGVNAVVLSAADTYATLITNGKADPDALPKISNLREYYNAALFDAPGALTLGIQYYVGSKVRDMPDTWVADAKTAPMQYGECNIPGIQKGDVVTYRAFASLKQGKLGQDTADAFAFGEQRSFTAIEPRRKLVIKDQQKTYDAKEFKLKSELYPQGATVAYYLKDTLLEHPPKDVGVYAAKVSVPAGDDAYLPGVYSVTMEIKRIVVLIYPEEVSKIQGQPDPEFPYTYQDTVMLGEDAVTGTLIRVAGEAYGNYAYLPDRLTAPSYYELVVDLYSPAFF
ncbi:MAG: MBG domain-containing protein, partial [Clostridia bacterium]